MVVIAMEAKHVTLSAKQNTTKPWKGKTCWNWLDTQLKQCGVANGTKSERGCQTKKY